MLISRSVPVVSLRSIAGELLESLREKTGAGEKRLRHQIFDSPAFAPVYWYRRIGAVALRLKQSTASAY
jgi:hypothetical protein